MSDFDPIEIEVDLSGFDEGADSTRALAQAIAALSGAVSTLGTKTSQTEEKVKKLKTAEELAADAARRLAQQQQLAATQAIGFAQRIAGVANAVQSLVGQLGSTNRTAGLVGATVAASAQFAAMGAALGPQGAVVGAIVGAMIPALQHLIESQDSAAVAAREHAEALTEVRTAMAAAAQAALQTDISSGVFGSDMTPQRAREEREVRRARIVAIEQEIQTEGDVWHRMARFQMGISDDAHERRMSNMRAEAAAARDQIGNLDSLIDLQMSRSGGSSGVAVPGSVAFNNEGTGRTVAARRGGGGGDPLGDASAAADARAYEHAQRMQEAQMSLLETEVQKREALRETAELARAEDERKLDATREQMDLEQEAAEALRTAARENTDALIEANRRSAEVHSQQVADYEKTTSVIVGGLTDALTSIVAGQKSAEEAFRSMLSAFLQYIAEQAALKAAFEFAEALASIPAAPLVATHLAAGLAFTALAVAAGAGAAAAAPPAATASAGGGGPQEGASSKDKGGGGGGTVVVNFNSPVMALTDRAQMGRHVQGLIDDANSRYG